MIHVKLTKMETVHNADHPAVLPTDYWVKIILDKRPEVGQSISAFRYERSRKTPEEPAAVRTIGHFASSPVMEIEGDLIRTMNSVWKMEELEWPLDLSDHEC